jgi:hypothetical protein
MELLTQEALTEVMQSIADDVRPWESSGYVFECSLQDAVRNHGRVDKMKSKDDDADKVAVKRMPTRWVRKTHLEFQDTYPTASEKPWMDIALVRYLNELRYPFACNNLGVFRDEETTYVVTSLASEGDLFGWCDRDPKPGLEREGVMRPLAVQMFSAVRWLHEMGIAHRDLSLENILLTQNPDGTNSIKLIDFGMSTLKRTCKKEVRGKQSYQAPEMHLQDEYDAFLIDEFALGVVLYAMGAQDYPWTSTKRHTCKLFEYVYTYDLRKFLTKRKLRKGAGESLAEVFSADFMDLLEGLLETHPKKRSCLGETCFQTGNSALFGSTAQRHSVWDLRWLEGCKDFYAEAAAQDR